MISPAPSSDLVRAALPLAVLLFLRTGPLHGYALMERLQSAGFVKVQGATLYPMLRRMEERGLVTHEWIHDESGPGRKVMHLTPAGDAEATTLEEGWAALSVSLNQIRARSKG